MDFFSKVKRAFGFSDDGSELEDELSLDVRSKPYVNPFRSESEQTGGLETPPPATDGGHAEAQLVALKEQMQQLMSMMRQMQNTQRPAPEPVVQATRDENGTDLDEIRQKLRTSETQRRQAQERANNLTEKIEGLQVAITTLENDKKGLLNKIRVMQVKAGGDGGMATTDAIEKMMEQHHEELTAKESQIAALRQQIEDTALTAEQAKDRVDQLEDAVRLKDDELARLKSEIEEMSQNLEIASEVQQKLEQVEQYKARKNAETAELKTLLDKARSENEQLHKRITQLNAQAKDTADKHKRRDIDVANHIDSLKEQLASAATIIEKHRSEQEKWQQQIKKLTQKYRESQQQLQEAHASATVANAQIKQLSDEVEALSKQLTAAHNELAAKENEPQSAPTPASKPPKATVSTFADIEDDLDDIDWLLPVEPDQPMEPEPTPDPLPIAPPQPDPRQLSLF